MIETIGTIVLIVALLAGLPGILCFGPLKDASDDSATGSRGLPDRRTCEERLLQPD
jgi:hypothetical protein